MTKSIYFKALLCVSIISSITISIFIVINFNSKPLPIVISSHSTPKPLYMWTIDEMLQQKEDPNRLALFPDSYKPPPGQQKYDQLYADATESVSFYVIAGASQKLIENSDMRGKYFEPQIRFFKHLNATVNYISDGPLTTNGIEFLVLPEGSPGYTDATFCRRSPETFLHFMKYHSNSRWYFRGTHDTFVNISALLELTKELEEKYGDPMTHFSGAYNCHEWNHIIYPHGGTGWLFSNFAMQQFVKNLNVFRDICAGSFDDVAMEGFLNHLGHPVNKFRTNKFIVTWPNTEGDIIYQKKWNKIPKCPAYYKLFDDAPEFKPCSALTSVSIHMHKVPMNQAWDQLRLSDPKAAVIFKDPNTPSFCMRE